MEKDDANDDFTPETNASDDCNYQNEQENILVDTDDQGLSSLFIGNLGRYCRESDLVKIFADYEIINAKIKVMKGSNVPLGYGFLRFSSHQGATRCMNECNGMLLNGRTIKIDWAQRNSRLLISNLNSSINREIVHEMFAQFGEIDHDASVIYSTTSTGGVVTNNVILEFEMQNMAERARTEMNGTLLQGRHMRVEWYNMSTNSNSSSRPSAGSVPEGEVVNANGAHDDFSGRQSIQHHQQDSHQQQQQQQQRGNDDEAVSVYVRFRCSVPGKLVDEELIAKALSPFGRVVDVSIKDVSVAENGTQKGYSFVHYEENDAGKEAVLAAARTLDWIYVDDVQFKAEVSKRMRRSLGPAKTDLLPGGAPGRGVAAMRGRRAPVGMGPGGGGPGRGGVGGMGPGGGGLGSIGPGRGAGRFPGMSAGNSFATATATSASQRVLQGGNFNQYPLAHNQAQRSNYANPNDVDRSAGNMYQNHAREEPVNKDNSRHQQMYPMSVYPTTEPNPSHMFGQTVLYPAHSTHAHHIVSSAQSVAGGMMVLENVTSPFGSPVHQYNTTLFPTKGSLYDPRYSGLYPSVTIGVPQAAYPFTQSTSYDSNHSTPYASPLVIDRSLDQYTIGFAQSMGTFGMAHGMQTMGSKNSEQSPEGLTFTHPLTPTIGGSTVRLASPYLGTPVMGYAHRSHQQSPLVSVSTLMPSMTMMSVPPVEQISLQSNERTRKKSTLNRFANI